MSKYGKQHLKLKISRGHQVNENTQEEKNKPDIETGAVNKFSPNFDQVKDEELQKETPKPT